MKRSGLKLNAFLIILAAVCTVGLAIEGESVAFLFASVFLFLITGVPVAIALGGSSLLFVLITGQVPDMVVVHRMVNGIYIFIVL